MTMDGAIVADFITAGTMLADRIRGGALEVGGTGVAADGTIVLRDKSNHTLITLNKEGIKIFANDGTLLGKFDSSGIDVKKGSIKGADITLGGTDNTNGTMKILDASGNVVASADRQGMNIYRGMFASYANNGSDRATVTDGSFKVWKGQEESPIAYMGNGGWEGLGESGAGLLILRGKDDIVLDASTGDISAQNLSIAEKITVNKDAVINNELDVYGRTRMHDELEVSGDIYCAGTSFETLKKRIDEIENVMGG